MLICILPWVAHATTLKEAMDMAGESHPKRAMSALQIEVAKGQLKERSGYAYNPELSLEPQQRQLADGSTGTDYYISISQGIELGGKTGYREQAAQAALDISMQRSDRVQQQLQINAANTFVRLYYAKRALMIRHQQKDLLQDLRTAVQRQLEVGDANILQVNFANAAYASTLSVLTDATQAFTLAQANYDTALGVLDTQPQADMVLPVLQVDWQVTTNPVDIALTSRADFTALKAQVRQFRAEANLAGADRIPDPTISLMAGEEGGEQLLKLGMTFALPLWNSHQGAYQASLAQESYGQGQLSWFESRLKREVQVAVSNYRYAMSVLNDVRQLEQPDLALNNIKLANIAFKVGELSLEDLVIHINQALDARLIALNMKEQGWLARIRLAEVLGHPEYILEGAIQ